LLDKINRGETMILVGVIQHISLVSFLSSAYYLPDWVPASHYVEIAKSLGLEDIKEADWSVFVVRRTRCR
jgi:hypothetical protein